MCILFDIGKEQVCILTHVHLNSHVANALEVMTEPKCPIVNYSTYKTSSLFLYVIIFKNSVFGYYNSDAC